MGSLPNLNELCGEKAHRRAQEKERDLARERVREREFARGDNKDFKGERLPIFIHPTQIPRHQHQRHSLTARKVHRTRSSGATHHIWDDPMIEHMAAYSPISSRSHRINLATTSIGPSIIVAGPSSVSATAAASAAAAAPPYQIQLAAAACRRRDSINSSIGATSIRRLLTVNRGCRHKVPVHIRSKVAKNFTFLIIAHGLVCAVLVPLFGLQGSNSTWYHNERWLQFGPNIGSLLLSICCLVTSGLCLLTTKIIKKIGYIALIAISYGGLCLFLIAHLYPSIYTLLPGYLILGATLGPAWISKWNLVVFFASRISCGQHECSNTNSTVDGVIVDDPKSVCSRDERIRRLARWFHAAENFGIVIGAILASVIMTCAANDVRCIYATNRPFTSRESNYAGHSNQLKQIQNVTDRIIDETTLPITMVIGSNSTESTNNNNNASVSNRQKQRDYYGNYESTYVESSTTTNQFDQQLVDTMFNTNEQGERICGADLCPVWIYYTEINYTTFTSSSSSSLLLSSSSIDSVQTNNVKQTILNATINGKMPLIIVYTIFAIIALVLSCLSQKIDSNFKNVGVGSGGGGGGSGVGGVAESIKSITDTLMFAGPMSYFIGTEQAYVLADFTKAFVSCSLGAQAIAGALIGMGLMQLIVSCTLSMLLRHTKRYAVLAAAFFFHACLLLVLSRWKPSSDDSALFYVITAAWGACNAIWETLLFALITLTHANHLIEIASPLQALRYLGLGVTFAAHGFLCENPKILILVILLVMTSVPYGMLELRLETQRKNQMVTL